MVSLAIKVLSVIAGIIAGVASYPYLNKYVIALLAFVGAIAVGIIAGALFYTAAKWVLAEVNADRP